MIMKFMLAGISIFSILDGISLEVSGKKNSTVGLVRKLTNANPARTKSQPRYHFFSVKMFFTVYVFCGSMQAQN